MCLVILFSHFLALSWLIVVWNFLPNSFHELEFDESCTFVWTNRIYQWNEINRMHCVVKGHFWKACHCTLLFRNNLVEWFFVVEIRYFLHSRVFVYYYKKIQFPINLHFFVNFSTWKRKTEPNWLIILLTLLENVWTSGISTHPWLSLEDWICHRFNG